MAYIYKKIVKGKPYYYLRVSKRVKGKIVVKDIAYLGSNPNDIKERLKEIPEKYKGEIRKTYRKIKKSIESEHYLNKIKKSKLKEDLFIDKKLLLEIEANKLHFNTEFLKLDTKTKNEIYHQFLIDFAYNTTSLEGNTITLEEAHKLLTENLTPKDRTLREIHDLKNTEKVFFDLINKKGKITHNLIMKTHDELMLNIDKRKGYRTHDIRVFKSRFDASPGEYVKTDMDLLLRWYEDNLKKLHPLVLAVMFHHKFERIHPFGDGNGRTGRMLMNYILLQSKYPPIIVRKVRRNDYLNALADADKSNLTDMDKKHYKKLIKFISEEFVDGYWNMFLV